MNVRMDSRKTELHLQKIKPRNPPRKHEGVIKGQCADSSNAKRRGETSRGEEAFENICNY